MKLSIITSLVVLTLLSFGCNRLEEKTPNQAYAPAETDTIVIYNYKPIIEQDNNGQAIVTIQNYQRAETHYFMKGRVDQGMFGNVYIMHKPTTADNQKVVRSNGDVLFCYSILDLTNPVTITLPENNGRFMEIRVFNEDHYMKLLDYEPGEYVFNKDNMNTRYIHVAIRILADANNPEDMQIAQGLQKAIKLDQKDSGSFEIPNWNQKSLETVRKGIQMASSTLTDSKLMFGDFDDVDDRLHLSGTALGWGGAPEYAAKYISVTPEENNGITPYTLKVKNDVPVDGFWSISVYNEQGYFEKNSKDLYTVNNISAKKDENGFITIHFGGNPDAENYLPICKGWNYTIRMYRAKPAVLNGEYVFPNPTKNK